MSWLCGAVFTVIWNFFYHDCVIAAISMPWSPHCHIKSSQSLYTYSYWLTNQLIRLCIFTSQAVFWWAFRWAKMQVTSKNSQLYSLVNQPITYLLYNSAKINTNDVIFIICHFWLWLGCGFAPRSHSNVPHIFRFLVHIMCILLRIFCIIIYE